MAQIYTIGLDNWPTIPEKPAARPLPFAARDLCWLAETPLYIEEERWRGRKVLDRRGRPLGHVRDVLVEVRSLEDSFRGGAPKAWGVRPVYFAVKAGPGWRWWARPREVLVAAGRLDGSGEVLRADVDALELWPRLFGRTFG
jgi:hypothetical protein